mmetsp:Transcript_117517/g.333005  ORF Transcript_117517/g.333005 Transcript_117517/m.333005 type:complete len:129 (+) Transcript_117517:87-473(+)
MLEFTGCFRTALSGGEVTPACGRFAGEIGVAVAYRNFVTATWKRPSASGVLVAFHNIVTLTVDASWQAGRQRTYCLSTVLRMIPSEYKQDLARGFDYRDALPLEAVRDLPGLGHHANISCALRDLRLE